MRVKGNKMRTRRAEAQMTQRAATPAQRYSPPSTDARRRYAAFICFHALPFYAAMSCQAASPCLFAILCAPCSLCAAAKASGKRYSSSACAKRCLQRTPRAAPAPRASGACQRAFYADAYDAARFVAA
jgi:hypothetical protein